MNQVVDYIYALWHWDNKQKTYFYVGRTIHPDQRIREHRYGARAYRDGDELKYQYANALNATGTPWYMEVLMECGPDTEHFEDFYINKLRAHPLMNMKAGDSEPWMGRDYSTPQDFVAARERALARARARAVLSPARAPAAPDVERTLFVGESPKDRFMSPWMRQRLANKR